MSGDERVEIGRVGVSTSVFDRLPIGQVREAVAELDDLGYGAVWFGEFVGREAVSHSAVLLAASRRLVVAAGIGSIARHDPIILAQAQRTLAEAYPGRFLLGLGGYRTNEPPDQGISVPSNGRATERMTEYLAAMDAAPRYGSVPPARPRRFLAAIGSRMLALSAELAWGAQTYLVTVEHTARARRIVGPDALLAVEQPVVLDTDVTRARELARAHVGQYLGTRPYIYNLNTLGYEEPDYADPSDQLVEALMVHGDETAIADRVRQHLDAGASHVCVQVLASDDTAPTAQWRSLAPALL